MKNLFTLFSSAVLLFSLSMSELSAQIVVLQYRSVPQDNVAEFIFRESNYWSQVANKAIQEGKLISWEVWHRRGGYDLKDDTHNFVFINVYKDKYALDANIWNIAEVFPHLRVIDMETTSLGRTIHELVLEKHQQAGLAQGKFAKFNYAKVSDMESFLAFEGEQWYPFINKAIREGDTSFIGWGLYTVLTPSGSQIPFDAVTIDHFDTYSEAVSPRWAEDIVYPDLESSVGARDRILAQIYERVVSMPN